MYIIPSARGARCPAYGGWRRTRGRILRLQGEEAVRRGADTVLG